METKVYNQDGKETGKITLPEAVFGVKWNADLVHQVVTSMLSNARGSVAHAKDRSEVSGGGKKPWKQKGTGRARHGSSRSPIWRHGGKAHGPRNEKNYEKTITKKMKAKALYTVLSKKLIDGEVMFVDTINFSEPKTKRAKEAIASLGQVKGFENIANRRKNAAYIGLGDLNVAVKKSFNNFGNFKVDSAKNLNPVDLLTYKYVVLTKPEETVKFLESKMSK